MAAAHHPTIPRPHGHLAVPEIKAYMQDIVPGVRVDPEERIALLRKGGVVRPSPGPSPGPSPIPTLTLVQHLASARTPTLARSG